MIASVPGVASVLSAPGSAASSALKLARKDPYRRFGISVLLLIPMSLCKRRGSSRYCGFCLARRMYAAASRSNSAGLQLYQPDSRAHIQLQPIFPRYRQRPPASHGRRNFRGMASAPYSASRQAWCCSMPSIHGTDLRRRRLAMVVLRFRRVSLEYYSFLNTLVKSGRH